MLSTKTAAALVGISPRSLRRAKWAEAACFDDPEGISWDGEMLQALRRDFLADREAAKARTAASKGVDALIRRSRWVFARGGDLPAFLALPEDELISPAVFRRVFGIGQRLLAHLIREGAPVADPRAFVAWLVGEGPRARGDIKQASWPSAEPTWAGSYWRELWDAHRYWCGRKT